MFKMVETNNIYPDLSASPLNDQQFRLIRINQIKDYFVAEFKESELMRKRLSKYIASFDYFGKSLIVLSITTGSASTSSFATVFGAPKRIVTAIFSLAFSIHTGIIQKLLKTTRKRKNNIIIKLK